MLKGSRFPAGFLALDLERLENLAYLELHGVVHKRFFGEESSILHRFPV